MNLGLARVLAEDVIPEGEANGVPPWAFGVAAFVVLALLLFIVSRINIDR